MSEKISRRVFLKTTGLAVLSVAAAGALEGCGALSPVPDNPIMPEVKNTIQTKNLDVGLGSLTGQWTSNASYESPTHNYLYTGISLKNTSSADVTVRTSDFQCTFGSDSSKKVRCIGSNVSLDKDTNYTSYYFQPSVTLKGGEERVVPLYIDLGSVKPTSLVGTRVTILLNVRASNEKVSFIYASPSDDPTPTRA